MRENLLGYLLGALDEIEHEKVRRQIENDPKLRHEYQCLESNLAALKAANEPYEPPDGLATTTCSLINEHQSVQLGSNTENSATGAFSTSREYSPELTSRKWSFADAIVAAGIVVAAAMLFFPSILNSRSLALLTKCQDNLRVIGAGLNRYSLRHKEFPPVPEEPNLSVAGIYTSILMAEGDITNPRFFICPADQLTNQINEFRIPPLKEIRNARGEKLVLMQKKMGGSYGYSLGYVNDQGTYMPRRNLGRKNFALLSDVPTSLASNRMSTNHGGCRYNVLSEDGSVATLNGCQLKGCSDDIFTSDRNLVEPGRHVNDSVIVPSNVSPFPASHLQLIDY